MRQRAFRAHAVLFAGLPGFERAQATQFAFHRDPDRMRHLAHAPRDLDVVVVVRRRLHVFAQRAVHHHAGKAGADRSLAHRRAGAVVLVQHDGDVRMGLGSGQHHMAQVGLAGILARTGRGLQDDRAVGLLGRFHDGVDLFQVVDVECRHAVAELSRVVQQLPQGNECHGKAPLVDAE
ncbi:hypothetical protein D9M70_527740 [compost metagenome]